VPQHQWVSKLFGYDFSVEFHPGRLNVVADALSRRGNELSCPSTGDATIAVLSGPLFELYNTLRHEFQEDSDLRAFRDTVVQDRGTPWRVVDGLVLRGAQVFVPTSFSLVTVVLELAHAGGHGGI
jgi:hypothetical protein